ncbi:hypothetical protein XELAEV_18026852mg [Xenopus laevis]|uniref:Uncharacterized protein n=1 Tax=Xenopus laevis TaxID=8355 RepID=A0A974CUH6_XENLA|nr:hypothetical protein XELAEV_18026852mg [Xenopus laevis]
MYILLPTRGNKTLYQCYTNLEKAFTATLKLNLGRSDHCGILLSPFYERHLESSLPQARTVQKWTSSAIDQHQDCLESTNWSLFKNTADDIHHYADTVSCYINCCTFICIPCTDNIFYPYQKPWFNNEVRKKLRTSRSFRYAL